MSRLDEDAEFVVTVTTPVSGRWSATILNNFWEEANTQADLTFSPPDTAAPQVASIARQSPTSSPTRADSLTWRVTFSETVANVDEADFEVGVPTATLTVAAVPGSSVAHDVTVEGGNLAGLTGTVTLAFASDHDIADTAGNALTNTVPTRANDNTFELDNTAPTVTIGGVPETSTAPFTATITFTEPVTGFVLADIALANATAAAFTGADGDRAFTGADHAHGEWRGHRGRGGGRGQGCGGQRQRGCRAGLVHLRSQRRHLRAHGCGANCDPCQDSPASAIAPMSPATISPPSPAS